MRIVFDNIVFSIQRSGGISVVWKELVSRFIRSRKDELTFIEYETNKDNIFHEEIDFPEETINKKNPLSFLVNRYCDVRMAIKEPFIFHSSYFRLCRNKNALNVTTVHDFTYDYFYKGKHRGAFLHIWQRNRAVKKSDAIVCISENTKRDLLKFIPDVNPSKVHIIYNAVSDEYHIIDNKLEGLKDKLLFVGERVAYKNGRWFAEAIRDTSYKVIFCGKPMDEEEKAFYDSVLGSDRYEIRTRVSNYELNQLYNSVKCLVYPSSYEGFGIPVLEAQKAGCPVIAYNNSSIPEVIGETPLLMNELTKEELLLKLNLLNDENVRQKVIEHGIENAKRFSWDESYEQYRQLYHKLLED